MVGRGSRRRERPSLAKIVATEIIDKVQVLSEHPQLDRPIAGRAEYRQIVLQVLGAAYVFQYRFDGPRLVCSASIMLANRESDGAPPPKSYRLRHPAEETADQARVPGSHRLRRLVLRNAALVKIFQEFDVVRLCDGEILVAGKNTV